jgi:malate/lactate dehydrogenase
MTWRVAIAGGAGGVGSSLAFNLLLRPEPYDVVVIDRRPEKVLSHVMDLEQVPALAGGGTVRTGACDDVAGADIVVICAAAPLTENTSRAVYLRDNAAIVAGLAERLRDAIGAARAVPSAAVDAYVLGEHGDAAVPVFSRVAIHGAPVTLGAEERGAADEFVRTWYRRHVALDSRRSSTWTSGAGAAHMVAALRDGADLWPASVVLAGEYGISGAAVTVPVALGPCGVERVHEWELAPEELEALRAAAAAVRAAAGLGGP